MAEARTEAVSTDPHDVACTDCLAFEPSADAPDVGECRRYAPIPQAPERRAVWPVVAAGAWCLQHRCRVEPFNLTFAPSDATIEPRDTDED